MISERDAFLTYLPIEILFLQWPGAKPSTPPSIFHVYTVAAIWTTFFGIYSIWSPIHRRYTGWDTFADSSPTTTIMDSNSSTLFYSFWYRFRTRWSLRKTSITRRMQRKLICFSSNLHVTGFSSCRITQMIHSNLVCVCVCVQRRLCVKASVCTIFSV